MAAKEHRLTLRGITTQQKKDLLTLNKNRKTSINTEVLFAIGQYLDEWKRSTPDWFKKPITNK